MNVVEDPTERPAEPGELCTCGRQARTVFLTSRWGEVGSCDTENSGQRPVLPCPFCGATEAYQVGGEIVKCPQYRLRGLDDLTDGGTVEEPTERPAEPDRRAAADAWFKWRIGIDDSAAPGIIVDMLNAAARWARDRPEQDQFTDEDDWWRAFERWERAQSLEASGLIFELVGGVRFVEGLDDSSATPGTSP